LGDKINDFELEEIGCRKADAAREVIKNSIKPLPDSGFVIY